MPGPCLLPVPFTFWENIFSGTGDADYQAEYVFITMAQDGTCKNNSYHTDEYNPGYAANSGSGAWGTSGAWHTNQGGSSSKACDQAKLWANTATQLSSDNAGSHNSDGPLYSGATMPAVFWGRRSPRFYSAVYDNDVLPIQAVDFPTPPPHGKQPALDLSVCTGPVATHPKAWRSPEDRLTGNTTLMVDACPSSPTGD